MGMSVLSHSGNLSLWEHHTISYQLQPCHTYYSITYTYDVRYDAYYTCIPLSLLSYKVVGCLWGIPSYKVRQTRPMCYLVNLILTQGALLSKTKAGSDTN